ncbi:MAG: hypothetical protein EXS31_15340 [Pedosphaera sp.]|nr:hypothetical protein [Pedosphaera sp.]
MNRVVASIILIVFGLGAAWPGFSAPAVNVSVALSTNRLFAGETAMLQVSAQVAPEYQSVSDQLFSWNIDLMNTSGAVAGIQMAGLQKPGSDHDVLTSGNGTAEESNLRGIFDTFLQTPGAGKDRPILLLSVPVVGKNPGRALLYVQAGSAAAGLMEDFLVATLDDGASLGGGDYSLARVELEVVAPVPPVTDVRSTLSFLTSQDRSHLALRYPTMAGKRYFVEFAEQLDPPVVWLPALDAPDNSGAVLITNVGGQRYYRIQIRD